jgi:hypothetical protein
MRTRSASIAIASGEERRRGVSVVVAPSRAFRMPAVPTLTLFSSAVTTSPVARLRSSSASQGR